jgi:hypothetical protein
MTSAIDATLPTGPHAYTADMRANFAAAKSEILALQSAAATDETDIAAAQTAIDELQGTLETVDTFTPAISIGGSTTGITYSTQYGKSRHTKEGRNIQLCIVLTSKGSATGEVIITGLGFTRASGTENSVPLLLAFNNAASTLTQPHFAFAGATSGTLILRKLVSGVQTAMADTDIGNATVIRVSGFIPT